MKLPIIAAIALACAVATPRLSAQSAMFTYTGVPAGPVMPGSSFTIGLNIVVATGGTIGNIQGLSYWMAQSSPAGGPFPFAITNRNVAGSLFTNLQSPGLPYPQILDPMNRNPPGPPITSTDLGQTLPPGQPGLPSGTYFLANITFFVAPNSVPGSYIIRNSTSTIPGVGGRISIFNDDEGDTAPISASAFTITVVPEPGSIALLCVGLVFASALAYRRRIAVR